MTAVVIDATGRVQITWQSAPGARYRLQAASVLAGGDWQDLTGDLTATTGETVAADPLPANAPQRFYRIVRVSP